MADLTQMVRALAVIAYTPHIRAYLESRDPKALAQVVAALQGAQPKPEAR